MLMHVRIRRNIYGSLDFENVWCEYSITKGELCQRYSLTKNLCDFYGPDGKLVLGEELDGEQITVLQRPGEAAAIVMGIIAVVGAGVSIGISIDSSNKAREAQQRAEEIAKRQRSLTNIYSYSLRGSTNDQRNNSPIPVVLGEVNATGDKAGLQYSTYSEDNFQFVHQLICLGYSGKDYNDEGSVVSVRTDDNKIVGGVIFKTAPEFVTPNPNQSEAEINPHGYMIRIADSPIDRFDKVYGDCQIGLDSNAMYYTERVIENAPMADLKDINDPVTHVTPYNTLKIRVGVYAPYGYYTTDDEARRQLASYSFNVDYRVHPDGQWVTRTISGSMNQSMYRNMVELDVSELFSEASDNQYEVRVYRNDYNSYYVYDEESGQYKLNDVSNCVTLAVEAIQCVTRAKNENIFGSKARHTMPLPYPARYALLSMNAKASDRTNGWMDQIFAEVYLKCRTYQPIQNGVNNDALPCTSSMWEIPTDEQIAESEDGMANMNNPAALLLYVLTCPQINPRPIKANQIDWESFRNWWQFCNNENRKWTCNAFVTANMTVAELSTLICDTGRAHLIMHNNKYSVYVEDKSDIISQIFTPRNAWNMVESTSFDPPTTLIKTSFVNEVTQIEETRYVYFELDENGDIKKDEQGNVNILFDNAEEVLLQESNYKVESIDIWGVTRAQQIAQLSAYRLYKGLFLRNTYTWECGFESLSCTVGDIVYLANDVFMSSLGYGRIKGTKVENDQIVGVYIDESIEIHEGQTYGLTIRTGAGDVAEKALFAANDGTNTDKESKLVLPINNAGSVANYLQFETPLPLSSDVTSGNLFIYNDATQLGKKVIIESIQPNEDKGAAITAVDYIEQMYDVDVETDIPEYISNVNKYGTGANIATGYNRWEQPQESKDNTIAYTRTQYYISTSPDELHMAYGVVTSDTSPVSGKSYYVKLEEGLYELIDTSHGFPTGAIIYEDAGWMYTLPVSFKGYAWYREEYTYTNNITKHYSDPTYFLKTVDVANPFTVTTEYATSTGKLFIQTEDTTPQTGKEYYIHRHNTVYQRIDTELGFPTGPTIFEIPDLSNWETDVPSSWKSGMFIWTRNTIIYDNQPNKVIIDTPVYSEEHTKQYEEACVFSGTVIDYVWEKNKRYAASTSVQVRINLTVMGYGNPATLVTSQLPTGVTKEVEASAMILTFNNTIDVDSFIFTIGLTEYPNIPVLSYRIESRDVTTEPQYLGLLTELPSNTNTPYDYFIEGDHFVPSESFYAETLDSVWDSSKTYYEYDSASDEYVVSTDNQFLSGKTYYELYIGLLPYVFNNGVWSTVIEGAHYNGMAASQIEYNSVKDIYENAEYVYEAASGTAQAGVTYYDGNHNPVIVQKDASVDTYYTRHLNIPPKVVQYYNYEEKKIIDHLTTNDIELVSNGDNVGKIRSAGYIQGTAQAIMNAVRDGQDPGVYNPGFYGDANGVFEAYEAFLVSAQIYNANIVGELRNDLFRTNLDTKTGAAHTLASIANSQKYWDYYEALNALKAAGLASHVIVNGVFDYPTAGASYEKAILIDSNTNKSSNISVAAGESSTALPVKAKITSITGRLFNGNNELAVGAILAKDTILTNRKRWLHNSLKSVLTANTLVTANTEASTPSGTYNGTNFKAHAYVTDISANAVNSASRTRSYTGGDTSAADWSWTVPTIFNSEISRPITISGKNNAGITKSWGTTYFFGGTVNIYIDGSRVYHKDGTGGSSSGWGSGNGTNYSWSGTVKAGQTIRVTLGSSNRDKSPYDYTYADATHGTLTGYVDCNYGTITFNTLGIDSTGFWMCGSDNNWSKLVDANEYWQSEHAIALIAPTSWETNDHCESASYQYDFSQYSNGLNLLNSSGETQVVVTIGTGMRPKSEHFAWAYNNADWDSDDNLYFQLSMTPIKADNVPQLSGRIFAISQTATRTFAYQVKGYSAVPAQTDITGVVWNGSSLVVEINGSPTVFSSGIYFKSLSLQFTSVSEARANYAASILPKENETDRVEEINTGAPDNRFDKGFYKELGSSLSHVSKLYVDEIVGVEIASISNATIDSIFV